MRAINRNKIIAVMAAIVVFMVSMCTYSAEANATNTSRTYYVYDAQSPFEGPIRDYTLDAFDTYPNDNSGNARSLIGEENRDIDWSKSGVCKIITSDGRGTGFVVDEHTIATAAHCLYDNITGACSINNISLYNTDGEVTLYVTAIEYHIPDDFISRLSADIETNAYDYALITVEEDLSDYMCFNLGAMLDSFATTNTELFITGFPGTVKNEEGNWIGVSSMYTGEGYLVNNTTYPSSLQIAYTNDTTGGNSGGPVYITETRGNYTYNTVIAVHTTAAGTYNIGTRITTDLLHFYLNNSFKVYE